jgi:hypothetical protein
MSKPNGKLKYWVLQARALCSCRYESVRTVSLGHNLGSVVRTERDGIVRKSKSSRVSEKSGSVQNRTRPKRDSMLALRRQPLTQTALRTSADQIRTTPKSHCNLKKDSLEFCTLAIHSGGVTCSALLPFLFQGFKSSLPRLIRWAAN